MGFFDIFKKKKKNKEIEINQHEMYSLGECPFCAHQGLLKLAEDDNGEVYIVCDETFHEFASMEDVETKRLRKTPLSLDHNYIELEEAIKLGYGEYIYVFKNNKWEKLVKEQ